jgi:hypothetical protein
LLQRRLHFQSHSLCVCNNLKVESLKLFYQLTRKLEDHSHVSMTLPTQGISDQICFTEVIVNLQIIVLDQL